MKFETIKKGKKKICFLFIHFMHLLGFLFASCSNVNLTLKFGFFVFLCAEELEKVQFSEGLKG